jgi:hypothetical protein
MKVFWRMKEVQRWVFCSRKANRKGTHPLNVIAKKEAIKIEDTETGALGRQQWQQQAAAATSSSNSNKQQTGHLTEHNTTHSTR